ncbi:MAG: NADH-quinone oxidoreductase subunit NuoG [Parachlamydiales bacterium]|jgi:NADH-quinone oxidoreductase subunit G
MTVETKEQTVMVNLTIDGTPISVPKGTTVYTAAKQLGIEIPIFCYHDRMPPFGACRMCLVEVEKMPKLQASCTLEATEGMNVVTQSNRAVSGRKTILELLLINHPLDCPICDRGGECPLQDQTLKYGPGESRFFEEKRHFKKALALGPVLMLDRERCITCARCTRFGDVIAGDHALEFIERGYKTEVGTPDSGPAESKFIGNTIEICPVGALTSKVYRFRARPWDNDATPSTCTLCPVGCSMYLDSRDGEIVRTRSKENKDVNDVWLCDKGYFGYEFVYHPERLNTPLVRRDGKLEPTTWENALQLVADKMKSFKANGKLAGLGGNPLTTEENFLFQKLMREFAGVNHVDNRVGTPVIAADDEGLAPGMEMSIGETEELSYAILCGIDLTEEFPVIWLRLRQAIHRKAKVVFIGHFAPEIAKHLDNVIVHTPGQEVDILKKHLPELLQANKKGAIFVGSQYLANPQRKAILAELLNAKHKTPGLSLNIMQGKGNSQGSRLAGMRPDIGPLGTSPNQPGFDSIKVFEETARSGWDLLYVAGANPAANFSKEHWQTIRSKLQFLVVQDLFLNETAQTADVVLPALCFIEKRGSFINIEGRIQQIHPGKDIPKDIYSDGEIFSLIAQKIDNTRTLALDSQFAEKLKAERLIIRHKESIEGPFPMDTASSKEGLKATFARVLFDRGVRMKHDPHLIQLAKSPFIRIHPKEALVRSLKDGDKVRLSANEKSITGKVKLDSNVADNTIVLPVGFGDLPVHELANNLLNGLVIELRKEV